MFRRSFLMRQQIGRDSQLKKTISTVSNLTGPTMKSTRQWQTNRRHFAKIYKYAMCSSQTEKKINNSKTSTILRMINDCIEAI